MPNTFKVCTALDLDTFRNITEANLLRGLKTRKSFSILQCPRLPNIPPQGSRTQQTHLSHSPPHSAPLPPHQAQLFIHSMTLAGLMKLLPLQQGCSRVPICPSSHGASRARNIVRRSDWKHHQRQILQKVVLKQSIHCISGALTGVDDLLAHPP